MRLEGDAATAGAKRKIFNQESLAKFAIVLN